METSMMLYRLQIKTNLVNTLDVSSGELLVFAFRTFIRHVIDFETFLVSVVAVLEGFVVNVVFAALLFTLLAVFASSVLLAFAVILALKCFISYFLTQ
jgi:hypothetical protein